MNSFLARARIAPRLICKAYLPAIMLLVVVAILSSRSEAPVSQWFKDPASSADMHPLTGFISNVGVLLWCTTMAICFFSAHLLRRLKQDEEAGFFLGAALLSLFLMLDDLFQMHESAASLGIRELYFFAFLGVAMLAYLWRFRMLILSDTWGPLFLAFALLGASVIVDVAQHRLLWRFEHWYLFLEDGLKFVGIAAWCAYFVDRAVAKIARPA